VLELGLSIAAWVASAVGFALLALSQERHWHAVMRAPPTPAIRPLPLRATGCALQPLALAGFVHAQGPGFGSLLWGVGATAAAMTVALVLSWYPRLLAPLAAMVAALGVRPAP
jgi:hypothetical protein